MFEEISARPRQPSRWFRLFVQLVAMLVVAVLGGMALLLWHTYETQNANIKRTKTAVQLSNLATMCRIYKAAYQTWPTFTPTTPPGTDFSLSLKNNTQFIRVMSGKPAADEVAYNKQIVVFATFQPGDLNAAGTSIVDAYGNDDIVIIMDTDGDKQIAPFKRTLTTANGKVVTIHQTMPIHSDVIVMSPGDGNMPITTWEMK